MKNNIEKIKNIRLFKGIKEKDIETLIECMQCRTINYKKNETILQEGDEINYFGVILEGNAHIIKDDIMGNRSIITHISDGDVFGEAFAYSMAKSINVNVISASNTSVMFMNVDRIANPCSLSCNFHSTLISNMLYIIAVKNLILTQKNEYISKRTIREKLLAYFSDQVIKNHKSSFNIPFNRQELADYLCVDRSALSNELGKLRDEGILTFNKNHFEIKMNRNF